MDQRASIHDMLPLEPACLHETSRLSLPLLHTLPTVAQRGWGVGDVVIKIPLTPGAESADQALTSAWWMRSSVLPSWRPRVIALGQSANSAKQPMPIWHPKHLPFVTNLGDGHLNNNLDDQIPDCLILYIYVYCQKCCFLPRQIGKLINLVQRS